ncbi:MAG: sigma 54-interacting transcriptional regulator [Planctomycetia bacterium]
MPAISAYLIVRDPVAGRSVTRLEQGKTVSLGRAPGNVIVVNDERASRLHAEILPRDSGWAIRDLGSRNGTLVEGALIDSERPLTAGDVIAIGLTELTFCEGEPPTDPNMTLAGTGAALSADMQAWQSSIRHRRARSRLLENLREAAEKVPRVGRAAAELCRLAFALGRAEDLKAMAKLALDAALTGVGAARGIVLLPARIGDIPAAGGPPAIAAESLVAMASVPEPWPLGGTPAGVAAAVIAADEAILASASPDATRSADDPTGTISAPIRVHGAVAGVLHLEVLAPDRECTPEDLEFVMSVCDALGVALDNYTAREALSSKLATTANENERLRRRLGEDTPMVVASPALQAIVGQLQRVAATKATVLIRGESGVGKELVAREIHDASDRRGGPFICLNCAALSETLLESELFGHEKGAFTGATERKIGKFEAAHKGTLMLDEIGEMSPNIQAKFLRVLEGHPFERVGGSVRVQVDVRVVAATNRDLEEAVAAGEFRRDLYFRLKVVEILVPPLRRRPEDVEAIAQHFLQRFAAETGRRIKGFAPEAIEAMRAYHWPGNIRELRNCVERAVVLAQDDWIGVHDMALSHLAAPGETGRQPAARAAAFVPATIDEVEHRHVMATLEAVGGNKTKAAAMLGIERSTLDRKLARWAKA